MEIAVSRTIKFAKAGGPEVLEFTEAQVPTPGPREVRIRVKPTGINRAESIWRNDKYVERVSFPAGLRYEPAAIVDPPGNPIPAFPPPHPPSTIPPFSPT